MRKRPLLMTAGVFLAGLVYQRYSQGIMVGILLLLLVQEGWFGRAEKGLKKSAGRSIVLLSAFLLGIFHMQQEVDFRAAYMSKIKDGSRVTVWGEFIKTETTDFGYRGLLSDCYIDFGEGIIPCNDVMVYTSQNHFQMGQIQKITGKVNMFSTARNEGNFDSLVYNQSLKIDFAIDEEAHLLLGEGEKAWNTLLFTLKEEIASVYENCLSEKAAGFYRAMVLGDKEDLETALKELFLIGGISHILAISGLHVSILGRGIYRILRKGGVGFGCAGVLGGFMLIFYCNMVGNSVSTIRAVGMMLFFFLAQWLGRSYDMLNALGGMVLFLLWENPFLIENSGFWFSVTALIGVGIVGKELSHKEGNRRLKLVNTQGLWMSIGITLTTLPITATSYYEIPIYAPLVNFIVLPLLAPVFVLAVVGGMLGVIVPDAGVVYCILQPCQWLLSLYEGICRFVSKLPGANIICGKPLWWQIVLYYGLLFAGVYGMRLLQRLKETSGKKGKGRHYAVLAIGVFLCSLCICFPKAKPFEITFLDVGQGDAVYISGGDGTTYFIDGGSSNVEGVGEYRILPFLKAKGIASIDYWFVSHADSDHTSGVFEVLESGYKVEHLVLPKAAMENGNFENLLYAAQSVDTEVVYMEREARICSKNLAITCIGPLTKNGEGIGENRNDNSLVLLVDYATAQGNDKFSALFAGDISSEIEKLLVKEGGLKDIDLFKANHHGSNYSNATEFLAMIKPEYTVVSCSKNNSYGHPGELAVERLQVCGTEIFYTMDGGQITFPLIQ